MNFRARLIVLTGPLRGTERPLSEGLLVIGRDLSSDLCIKDRALSRHHCRVVLENGTYVVEDMGSRNGTMVNDRPAEKHILKDGDRIQIGGSLLLFVEGEWPRQIEARLDDGTGITKASAQVSLEGAMYALARDLGILLKIGTELNTIRSPVVLYQKLLDSIFSLIPADRGAILLTKGGAAEVDTIFALDRWSVGNEMRISRTVVKQVLSDGDSLLSNDVLESDALYRAESLLGASVSALICAPLLLLGKVIGLIYIDSRDPEIEFNEGHLNTLTALAGFAAGTIEATKRLDRLESENRRLHSDLKHEHQLLGESKRISEVRKLITKIAPADSSVLILGESGTGKELAARAIHRNSTRADGPFIAINCATLTESLLESELFGYEKGAFTGAVAQKKGKLEAAHGGITSEITFSRW
jgi:transcriptional regulator with GAF, ATPase, and Fis domain